MTAITAVSRSAIRSGGGTSYGIRASWIFRLARTSRCATVGSGTRKARAISGVASPPRVLSVSATCASRFSAGWQQVKISRSRSSGYFIATSSVPSGCPRRDVSTSYKSESCFSMRVFSLRTASISLRCATAVIQAPGFSGVPLLGQVAKADANASCMASSARSKEPESRIKVAMIRPDSSRNTDSTEVLASAICRTNRTTILRLLSPDWKRSNGSNLDATFSAAANQRDFRGPPDRFIQILAVQNVIAGKLFLGFRERAVQRDRLTTLHPNGGGRAGRLQRLRRPVNTELLGLLHDRPMCGRSPLDFLRRGGTVLFFLINQQHVTHHRSPDLLTCDPSRAPATSKPHPRVSLPSLSPTHLRCATPASTCGRMDPSLSRNDPPKTYSAPAWSLSRPLLPPD